MSKILDFIERAIDTLRACECFEVPLLLTGVLLVESALWNFHRVEYLFRWGTLR